MPVWSSLPVDECLIRTRRQIDEADFHSREAVGSVDEARRVWRDAEELVALSLQSLRASERRLARTRELGGLLVGPARDD